MTAVEGNVVRPIGLDTFADITDAPLVLTEGRLGRGGLVFDGELTPEQVDAIRDRMTSRDDGDQQRRLLIKRAFIANRNAINDPLTPKAEKAWRAQNNLLIRLLVGFEPNG